MFFFYTQSKGALDPIYIQKNILGEVDPNAGPEEQIQWKAAKTNKIMVNKNRFIEAYLRNENSLQFERNHLKREKDKLEVELHNVKGIVRAKANEPEMPAPQPKIILFIRELSRKAGESKTYKSVHVKLKFPDGTELKTNAIQNTSHPIWGEYFKVKKTDRVEIRICEDSDKVIGKGILSFRENGENIEDEVQLKTDDYFPKAMDITLQVKYSVISSELLYYQKLSKDIEGQITVCEEKLRDIDRILDRYWLPFPKYIEGKKGTERKEKLRIFRMRTTKILENQKRNVTRLTEEKAERSLLFDMFFMVITVMSMSATILRACFFDLLICGIYWVRRGRRDKMTKSYLFKLLVCLIFSCAVDINWVNTYTSKSYIEDRLWDQGLLAEAKTYVVIFSWTLLGVKILLSLVTTARYFFTKDKLVNIHEQQTQGDDSMLSDAHDGRGREIEMSTSKY
eukprot:TRINITY_DN6219_c0_g2_i11.p1 TRINITY_DN6219_c0_g2~~TRINITY_DN6219_c0_g2_i11.p1  ORF type:complete len:453 (-),score=88.37 TRINITY_DN6219_c0_g2_i11:222-1580(-)